MGGCLSGSSVTTANTSVMPANPTAAAALNQQFFPPADGPNDPIKIISPGCGESGKSTVFKQTIINYGNGFSEYDRSNYSNILMNNIITTAKTLVKQCRSRQVRFDASGEWCADIIDDLKGDETLEGNLRDVIPVVRDSLNQILLNDLMVIVTDYAVESLAHIIYNFVSSFFPAVGAYVCLGCGGLTGCGFVVVCRDSGSSPMFKRCMPYAPSFNYYQWLNQ